MGASKAGGKVLLPTNGKPHGGARIIGVGMR